MFFARKSRSAEWGIEGYYWIPYDYLTNPDPADDFLAIHAVTAK